MIRRASPPAVEPTGPRYRSEIRVGFSAAHARYGPEPGPDGARSHGHDFTAVFTFEADMLTFPGVVIDDDLRGEITHHVQSRLAYRDLDRLLGKPATCEVTAEHLATWFLRSARPPGHARLASITVTTGSGTHGAIVLSR